MEYHSKYLKYKEKYLTLKKGGGFLDANNENMDFFLNFNMTNQSILEKFQHFNNLELMNHTMLKIGKTSSNGFIYKIKFNNNLESFDTILKTTIDKKSDNNYYEFVVGNCINRIKEYFPNFVYTFNFLTLSQSLKNNLKDASIFTKSEFIKDAIMKKINLNELQNNNNIGDGCENNDRASVLIEFIPNSLSLTDLTNNSNFLSSVNNLNIEVYNILFQIYATLSALKEVYTHYDLHTDNIMFIEIPEQKKLQIDYNIEGKIYSIYTSFIPVILDYGRSFVDCLNIDGITYSRIFSEVVCDNPKCNSLKHPKCDAKKVGLVIEKNEEDIYSKQADFHNINLRNKNESFDLRYLHNFMLNVHDSLEIKKDYNKYFENETRWVSRDPRTRKIKTNEKGKIVINYGVKEDLSDFYITKKISNTTDCFKWLLSLYSRTYNNLVPTNLYGTMKINYNFKDRVKWTFQKNQ
jgi:hypothetical protein